MLFLEIENAHLGGIKKRIKKVIQNVTSKHASIQIEKCLV